LKVYDQLHIYQASGVSDSHHVFNYLPIVHRTAIGLMHTHACDYLCALIVFVPCT